MGRLKTHRAKLETDGRRDAADTKTGELAGGLQAPFVFRDGARFVMFYGGWNDICSATSDGRQDLCRRKTDASGKVTLFGTPSGNTRDPMVIRIGDRWHCYYTAHPENRGAVYCRTSPDLTSWSEARIVARGRPIGRWSVFGGVPVCGGIRTRAVLSLPQSDLRKGAKCSVYFSHDPLDFGVAHDDGHFVCTLPIAAPEIINHEGQYYIVALLPSLKGIQVAKLTWE